MPDVHHFICFGVFRLLRHTGESRYPWVWIVMGSGIRRNDGNGSEQRFPGKLRLPIEPADTLNGPVVGVCPFGQPIR